jgi:hypothetical protein
VPPAGPVEGLAGHAEGAGVMAAPAMGPDVGVVRQEMPQPAAVEQQG